jgi:HSP20 family protein
MELVRFSPFGKSIGLRNHVDSIFNEFFNPAVCVNESAVSDVWNPIVDVYENDEGIVVKAEVPGVEKNDISVDIHDGVLTVKGERKHEEEVKENRFYRKERVYGKFQRAFRLPEGTNYDKINADFKDGILTVTVPKVEEKKAKQITIH